MTVPQDAQGQNSAATVVHLHSGNDLQKGLARWEQFVLRDREIPLSRHPGWLFVLRDGLQQVPYCLEAVANGQTVGLLPLAFVHSFLFGRFLVSMPYLNYGGVSASSE